MSPDAILAIMFAIGVLIAAYLILDTGSASSKKRVLSIRGEDKDGGSSVFSFLNLDDTNARRKLIESSLDELEQTQKAKQKKRKSLRSKLLQANSEMAPHVFTMISAAIAIVLGAPPLISAGIGFALGFGVPRWILNFKISGRQKKFKANFSDAMDIIVRGVRTGLPLGDCLRMIAHESPEPIKGEFTRLVEGESVGVPIDICIEKMYERVPLPEVNFFGTVLNIQRSTGGNLGESLANLSKVLRERKLLREKIKAMSAEAKASAMIIGALPPGVMVMVSMSSPDYMMDLYTTPTGQRNLMFSAFMMMFGIWVMRKMINFKF